MNFAIFTPLRWLVVLTDFSFLSQDCLKSNFSRVQLLLLFLWPRYTNKKINAIFSSSILLIINTKKLSNLFEYIFFQNIPTHSEKKLKKKQMCVWYIFTDNFFYLVWSVGVLVMCMLCWNWCQSLRSGAAATSIPQCHCHNNNNNRNMYYKDNWKCLVNLPDCSKSQTKRSDKANV